jgi:hypothetical protein
VSYACTGRAPLGETVRFIDGHASYLAAAHAIVARFRVSLPALLQRLDWPVRCDRRTG